MRRLPAVLLLLVLAACSNDKPEARVAPNSVEQGRGLTTLAPGKLTVCVESPHAPFAFYEADVLQGIDVDLAKAVSGRLGLEAVVVPVGKPVDEVKAGKCDVAASASTVLKDVYSGVELTRGYFGQRVVLAVRPGDEAKYPGFQALRGKPVAFPRTGAGMVYATDQGPQVQARMTTSDSEALGLVETGAVEAAVVEQALVLYRAKGGARIAAAAVLDQDEEPLDSYAFAVPSDKTDLKAALDTALSQVTADDTFRIVLTNYLRTVPA